MSQSVFLLKTTSQADAAQPRTAAPSTCLISSLACGLID